jgi:hypothetical protein
MAPSGSGTLCCKNGEAAEYASHFRPRPVWLTAGEQAYTEPLIVISRHHAEWGGDDDADVFRLRV